MNGELISNLKKFGLSENEAKAYIALVFMKGASARELHDLTEIPRAKVYEILDSLVEKRYAVTLKGTPIHYRATEPEDLVQMHREDFEVISTEVLKSFEELEFKPCDENGEADELTSIQYLRSEWTVRKKLNEMFDQTKKTMIILSRSPEPLKAIESDLISFKKRLNIMILVSTLDGYDKYSLPITVFPDSIRPLLEDLEDSHLTNQSSFIITDSKKAIAIRKDGAKMEAHFISQSVIDFLFKTIYYFVTNADSIELPEEITAANKKTEPESRRRIKSCGTGVKNERGRRGAAELNKRE